MGGCLPNLKIDFATEINVVCKFKAQPLMPFAEPCGAKKRTRLSRAILVAKGGHGMILYHAARLAGSMPHGGVW
jgi:hypothetical protein